MLRRLSPHGLGAVLVVLLLIAVVAYVTLPSSIAHTQAAPQELWPGTGAWAQQQLAEMTLEEKVSHLFSVRAYSHFQSTDDPDYRRLVELVDDFGIGGVAFFQGAPLAQAALVNDLQERADVPLLISQDMEWGAGMRIERSTTFPRAMALGATRDPELARNVGYVTAREARAMGTHQIYAPVADVNNNPGNPIINVRSFGQNPQLVAEMSVAFIDGVQRGDAIATAKHFPGHGDTEVDSHRGLPVLPFGRARLEEIELVPFRAAIDAGVKSVMVGHLALPEMTNSDVPATLSPEITTGLLREEMGFDGLIVTDGLDMSGVTAQYSPGEAAVRAVEAGSDVLLLSTDVYAGRAAILQAIEEGRLTEDRIDESVLRILRAKEWLNLPEDRMVAIETARRAVSKQSHLALSAAIAQRSLTLLQNEGDLLPLHPDPQRRIASIALSDSDDPDRARLFHGYLRTHAPGNAFDARLLDQRSAPNDYEAAVEAARDADVVVVPTYLRVRAWSGRIGLSNHHRAFVNDLIATGTPVVLVSFGNPYITSDLDPPAAYVAAYSESATVQKATAEALFGHGAFQGKLPVVIPGYADYGAGLQIEQSAPRDDYPEAVGMDGTRLHRVDSLLRASIREGAFPGAAVAVGRGGVITKHEGYGYFTYAAEQPVDANSVFDLASLTKVVSTTTAVMKLYEEGRLNLDARVAEYLPAFGQGGKEAVTIRQLLTHSAGLHPFRPFHTMGYTVREEVVEHIMGEELEFEPGTQSQYSDLGMITLMLVVEEITGEDFGTWTKEHVFEPLGMYSTGYRATGVTEKTIVPTEVDEAFRERLLQGEVHDEAAWILGGTSGHAGLFSTAGDLSKFAYMLLNDGRIYGQQFLQPETITLFTRRAGIEGSTRALGWDTRSPEGYSSAGSLYGPRSFGHTGYTGTSLWIDPDAELFAILLTNRVYPTRENRAISDVRPKFHDLVHEAIVGPPAPIMPLEQAAMAE